jgi:DNA-directed RNA polymerase subunit RPC12/RpoP
MGKVQAPEGTHIGSVACPHCSRQLWYVRVASDLGAQFFDGSTFPSGLKPGRLRSIDGQWRLVNIRVNSPEFLKDMAAIACPHCGEACPASAKFCPKCGKPLGEHGENKAASARGAARANNSAADAAPPRPPAR